MVPDVLNIHFQFVYILDSNGFCYWSTEAIFFGGFLTTDDAVYVKFSAVYSACIERLSFWVIKYKIEQNYVDSSIIYFITKAYRSIQADKVDMK